MPHSNVRLLAIIALSISCGGDRPATEEPAVISAGTGASTDSESGDVDTEDAMPEPKLDLGDTGGPASECASVTRTASHEERPVDLLLVGVADTLILPDFDFRWWISDIPIFIEENEISDARMVVLVEGDPALHMLDDTDGSPLFDSCDEWYCGEGTSVPLDIVDVRITEDRPLQGILDTSPHWLDLLRPEARKHVMVWAPTNQDLHITGADFVEEVTDLDESFEGLKVHALLNQDDGGLPFGALEVAARITGGLYDDGNEPDVDEGFFETVLDRIRESTLACRYDIPEPPNGLIFDQNKVNVAYDEGLGLELIGYVPAASDCDRVGPGWHYDDETNPTEIVICPFLCDRFAAATGTTTLDIEFGCTTIPAG